MKKGYFIIIFCCLIIPFIQSMGTQEKKGKDTLVKVVEKKEKAGSLRQKNLKTLVTNNTQEEPAVEQGRKVLPKKAVGPPCLIQ